MSRSPRSSLPELRTVVLTALGVAVLVGGAVGGAIGWLAARLGLKHP